MLRAVCGPVAAEAGAALDVATFADLAVEAATRARRDAPRARPARRHRPRLRNADGGDERDHGARHPDRFLPCLARCPPHHRHAGAPDRGHGRRRLRLRAGPRPRPPHGQIQRAAEPALSREIDNEAPSSPAFAFVPRRRGGFGPAARRSAEHGLSRHQGRADRHPPAAGPRAEACRADQGADQAGLLQRRRLPPRHRRLHGPDRRPHGHRHRRSKLPNLPAEFTPTPYKRGSVGMARSQSPNSANSQFFICFDGCGSLTGQYTLFGEVVVGHGRRRQDQEGLGRRERPGHEPRQDRQDAGRGGREVSRPCEVASA